MRSITESSGELKMLVDEVKLGSEEHARRLEQVAKALAEIDSVTQTTAANAEQSASAGEELRKPAWTAWFMPEALTGRKASAQGRGGEVFSCKSQRNLKSFGAEWYY